MSSTPPPAWPADADPRDFAGFWRRFGALVVDTLLLGLLWGIVLLVAPAALPLSDLEARLGWAFFLPMPEAISAAAKVLWDFRLDGPHLVQPLADGLMTWAYYALQESSKARATLGKRLFGVYVNRVDGAKLSLASASLRAWPHYLGELGWIGGAWLVVIIDLAAWAAFIAVAFSRRKQGLHDRMAGAFLTRR